MDNRDYLKSSPALQLSEQLDTPLNIASIAQTTVSQIDGILSSVAMANVMSQPYKDWIKEISSVTATSKAAQQAWTFETSSTAKSIDVLESLARETASMVLGLDTRHAGWGFEDSPAQRIIDAVKVDWDPITEAMKSAQKTLAFEANSFSKIAESWRQGLAKETTFLATAWKPIQATWTLDAAHITRALQPLEAQNLQIAPAWAASISLEKLELPRTVLYSTSDIQLPTDSLSRKPFSNYRMAKSYDLLSEFERDLRHFIHQRMHEAFGPEWEKHRVPGEIYKGWREKQKKAAVAGEPQGLLIDYADFTDYVTIITQRNNWTDVFKAHFGRAEFVRESLYRLHPIRLCVMHSRHLPRNMWLVLQTETTLLSDKIWN